MTYREELVKTAQENNFRVLKNITINKTVTSMEETFTSPEYKELFEGIVDSHSKFMLKESGKLISNYKAHFTDEGIFEEYTADGIDFLKKITTSACISNYPFQQAFVYDGDFFIVIERNWADHEEARRFLREWQGVIRVF